MPVIRPGLRIRPSAKGLTAFVPPSALTDRLSDLGRVANNPGDLIGRFYVPEGAKGPMPLVVVLHGCTQNAAAYDHGSGWSHLADRHGFALLFPEQQRSNNAMLCFNWFSGNDTQRGMGEAASIRSMIDAMRSAHDIDPGMTFVTGLSAGGAMASVMLAAYPEVFAAGAIIAGVAFGCASGMSEAFSCMGGGARNDARELGDRVRRASPHKGPWPRVQVWQGSADRTVDASNAESIILQWADLHGLPTTPTHSDMVEGHPRRIWADAKGTPLVEHFEITGMAHGTPLDPGTEDGQSGQAGAHMLDVGLSSTDRIAAFFGIVPAAKDAAKRPRSKPAAKVEVKPSSVRALAPLEPTRSQATPEPASAAHGVQKVIEDALRAAGLMK